MHLSHVSPALGDGPGPGKMGLSGSHPEWGGAVCLAPLTLAHTPTPSTSMCEASAPSLVVTTFRGGEGAGQKGEVAGVWLFLPGTSPPPTIVRLFSDL